MALSEADLQLVFEASGIKELIAQTKSLNAAMEKLIAEGNRAEHEMDDLGKKAKSTGSDFGGLGKAMGGLGGIMSGLGLAVGAAEVLNLGKQAINSAIAYETLSVQFEVFLGSAEKAQQVLGDLNKFSIETPFTPDQVNAAGRSLLAFGVTAENLIPTMKQIGDVSAAVGKDYNELATIFGKAKTAGTIFAEDINQLTEAGVPIIDELAKVFGVATDQVKKLGSEGKIHFSDLEKAFANMTGEGGRFNGMMDKMSQSTEGLLSTIEGKLQDELRKIGEAMLPTIRTIVEGFEPAFASVKEAFITIYTPLADALSAFGDLFSVLGIGGQTGNKFANIISTIATVLKIVTLPAQLFWKAVGFIVEKFVQFIKWAGGIIEKVGEIKNAFDVILFPIRAVTAAFNDLFGETEQKAGLSQAAMGGWTTAVAEAQRVTGATTEQIWQFTKSFDRSRVAGLSAADATRFVVAQLNNFVHASSDCSEEAEILTNKITDQGHKFKFAAGSIGHYEELLKLLQDRYKAATSDIQRLALDKKIEAMQFQLAKFNNEVARMKPISLNLGVEKVPELKQLNSELEKMHERTTDMSALGQRTEGLIGITNAYIQAGEAVGNFTDKLTFQGQLIKAFGESGFEALKSGLASVKNAFVDFGTTSVEMIGRVIGSGESLGGKFLALFKELLQQVPKLAGMALIQAAASPDPMPVLARLGLLGLGLGLVGLSGLIGGIQQRNDAKRADQEVNMNGIQGGVNGRSSSPQGLGQVAGQMQPIQLQLNIDGAAFAHATYGHFNKEKTKRG